jgi:tRNA threonylcarbamoyladenosine biosynthesis protein TsaE
LSVVLFVLKELVGMADQPGPCILKQESEHEAEEETQNLEGASTPTYLWTAHVLAPGFMLRAYETRAQMTDALRTTSSEQTARLGETLACELHGGELVLLRGPLGAGKSTLASGIGRGLGVRRWRGSPTFTLVHEYSTIPSLVHADLYRIDEAEVDDLGLDEHAGPDSVLAVEWPERAYERLLRLNIRRVIDIDLEIADQETRLIRVTRTDVPPGTRISPQP